MDSLTEDLCVIILSRLPLKTITASKLVCKKWKSIVESPFFRDLFMSLHQNSPSSAWSMYNERDILAHYRCDTWGLEKSLASYITSFLTDKFETQKVSSRVVAYSDAGLILIQVVTSSTRKVSPFVANPVSRECVEIFLDHIPIGFETLVNRWDWGIATQVENGVLLGYKAVIFEKSWQVTTELRCLIYSSETGLWSLDTFHLPYPPFAHSFQIISLNGSLHWIASNANDGKIVSVDLYATGGKGTI